MQLLIDASSLTNTKTGVGNYNYYYIDALAKKRPELQLILISNQPVFFPPYPNVTRLTRSSRLPGSVFTNVYHPYYALKYRVDGYIGGSGYIPLLLTLIRVKSLLVIHDFVYRYAGNSMTRAGRLVRAIIQPLSIAFCDKLVTVSEATASDLSTRSRRKLLGVSPPVSSPIFRPPTSAQVRGEYFFTFATVEPRKNLLLLLDAFETLHNEGVRPKLIICGGGGWNNTEIKLRLQHLSRLGIVEYLGYQPDEVILQHLQSAKAFISLSSYEGFGMPLREAMLSGTPVICSDIPSHREATINQAYYLPLEKAAIMSFLQKVTSQKITLTSPPPTDIPNNTRDGIAHIEHWLSTL